MIIKRFLLSFLTRRKLIILLKFVFSSAEFRAVQQNPANNFRLQNFPSDRIIKDTKLSPPLNFSKPRLQRFVVENSPGSRNNRIKDFLLSEHNHVSPLNVLLLSHPLIEESENSRRLSTENKFFPQTLNIHERKTLKNLKTIETK